MNIGRVIFKAAGKVGDQMIKNAETIRESEQKKKDYLFTKALENQAKVKQFQTKLMADYNALKGRGVEERRLKRYLSKNPAAISYIANILEQNPDKFDGADADIFLKINEENPDIAESVDELVENAFVKYDKIKLPDAPEQKEKTIFQRLFSGVDTDEINRNVAMAEILPGITGAEIIAGMDTVGTLRTGDGGMRPDYSVLKDDEFTERQLLLARQDLIGEYDSYLENLMDSIVQGDDPTKDKELTTLNNIKDLGDVPRLNALIEMDPSIAQRYRFDEAYGSDLFDPNKGILSSTTIKLVSPPDKEGDSSTDKQMSSALGEGTGEGTGDGASKVEVVVPEKIEVVIPKAIEGTVEVNADGKMVFATPGDAKEANENGAHGPAIIGGQETILTPEPVDMTGAPGYRENVTLEQRVATKKREITEVLDTVDNSVAEYTANLDQKVASGVMTVMEYGNTILGVGAQMIGADNLANFFYTQAIKSEDDAKNTKGLLPAINELMDKLGVPDYSESDNPEVALNRAVQGMLSVIPQDEKYDEALTRAPAHIEKLGNQATNAWRELKEAISNFSFSEISLLTPDDENYMISIAEDLSELISKEEDIENFKNVFTRTVDTPAYKRLEEMLAQQAELAEEEAEKTRLKKARKVVKKVKEVEEKKQSLDLSKYPVAGMPRDSAEITASPEIQQPSPSEDSGAPSKVSRFEGGDRPGGLMSPTAEGTKPKLGSTALVSTVRKLHGSGSNAAKTFEKKVSSDKIKAADITRLIKSTKKLPYTDARRNLLEELYDFRDTLNNR